MGQIPSKDSIIECVNILRSTYKRAFANKVGGILILPNTMSIFFALSGPIIDTFYITIDFCISLWVKLPVGAALLKFFSKKS